MSAHGRKTLSERVLRYSPRNCKLLEVIGASRLGAHSGMLESSEGLPPYQRAGASTIQIQITDPEVPRRIRKVARMPAEYAARQPVITPVCLVDAFLESADLCHGKDRPEQFIPH